MEKKILGIVSDKEKRDSIAKLCQSLTIAFEEVPVTEINTPIGKFLKMPLLGAKPGKGLVAPVMYFPPELLVFYNLTDKDLDLFLANYKEQGIAPISLKGTVTPFNLSWTFYELIKEYENEVV